MEPDKTRPSSPMLTSTAFVIIALFAVEWCIGRLYVSGTV